MKFESGPVQGGEALVDWRIKCTDSYLPVHFVRLLWIVVCPNNHLPPNCALLLRVLVAILGRQNSILLAHYFPTTTGTTKNARMCWLRTGDVNCIKCSIITLLQKIPVFIDCHNVVAFRL